ncbi:uncharacterized protein [Dermacentor albipictus]|uniref:uncharacterized protein n=1 Tax=Dermacentor albipictus TaxID=60249 RepID=UPI0038FD2C81
MAEVPRSEGWYLQRYPQVQSTLQRTRLPFGPRVNQAVSTLFLTRRTRDWQFPTGKTNESDHHGVRIKLCCRQCQCCDECSLRLLPPAAATESFTSALPNCCIRHACVSTGKRRRQAGRL